MKRILWTIISIAIIEILVITLQINLIFGENGNSQQYPIICKNELGPYPKNESVKKVDVNSDGLIDLIAEFSWGGSALYINCGHEKYYRAILGYGKMEAEKTKTNNWVDIYNSGYIGLVDGKIYHRYFLPFNFKNSEQIIPEDFYFKHDGYSYKPQFSYSKSLRVYAPRYRFDPKIQVTETIKEQVIDKIYLELTTNSNYQINRDDQGLFCFGVLYFVDLNKDGALDAILRYTEKAGVDAQAFAGLLLNGGDNSFIFSAEIELGSASIDNYEGIKSQTITIDGKQYTAIVSDGPQFRYETKKTVPKDVVELYIYQEKFKQIIHVTALPGKDKSTFIPLDGDFFEEEITNPPLFQNHPIELTEVKEGTIITLIGNYEQSLIKAINSNDFPLVEKYLTPGSNLYNAQKNLVANLYKKGIQEKLLDYKVEEIETTGQANVYKVYAFEKIGIKRPGKPEFTASEFRWVYTVVFDDEKYTLSDIDKWDGE